MLKKNGLAIFILLPEVYLGANLFAKMINNFKSINIFAKSSVSVLPMFVVTEFFHNFQKTIWGTTTTGKI